MSVLESPEGRTPPRSIAEIRAIDRETRTSGHELIKPEEARERNLQNAFVEVLAHSGIPFETAFEIGDVAWEIHQIQIERRSRPDEPQPPIELSQEDIAAKERWETMTPEERDAESKAVWERLDAQPGFRRSMRQSIRQVERGEYFSRDILDFSDRIPKLKVVKKSEASRRWEEYERRIPGLRGRLIQAQQDLIDGKGSFLMEDGSLVPLQEYRTKMASQASEEILIDNTPAVDLTPSQE